MYRTSKHIISIQKFTACYEKGDLSIDTKEILEAQWFDADTLPFTPGKQSLAGELISWFVRSQK